MKEFELINRLTGSLPGNSALVTGPGDDCAVLDLGVSDRFSYSKRMPWFRGFTSAGANRRNKSATKLWRVA